jgi:Fic family protein
MKIPVSPPKYDFNQLVNSIVEMGNDFRPTTREGEYLHWDKVRHLTPPPGLSLTQWWFVMKLARRALYREAPFQDKYGNPFVLATADSVLSKLHSLDRSSGFTFLSPVSSANTDLRDMFLVQSLMEEAITSSQLEGASTTRKVAKEMLRTNRKPRDISEKMIFNNYHAMQFVREMKEKALTVEMILELHRILTKDTFENRDEAGRLRTTDDVHVWDNTNQILHTPPKASELPARLQTLCEYANKKNEDGDFFHPILKAILLHFMLAYDHPFPDGNGRTARALFYWSMAHQGYWLMEYISISDIIKKSSTQYALAYLHTETDDNDLTYFLLYQLDVIIKAIQVLYENLQKQNQEMNEIEKWLHDNKALQNKLNYRQIALIKHALKHSNSRYVIEGHRQAHQVTYDTARTDLLGLVELGLLTKQLQGKAFTFTVSSDLKSRLEGI